MKKIFFVSIAFLFVANVHAQIIKLGIKAGINYANQTGTSITVNSVNYNAQAITSYHFGAIGELAVFSKLSLQSELLYSTQGADYSASGVTGNLSNRLGYVSIPVLAKIHLNNVFSLDLGPQASFLLVNKDDFAIKDTKTFDFGAAAGLGVRITKDIFIQGRYVLGLSEVSTNAKAKNSVLQVSAGFFF